jgi:hypothetical protein
MALEDLEWQCVRAGQMAAALHSVCGLRYRVKILGKDSTN